MNQEKIVPLSIYTLISVSIISCLVRCDYNLFFGFGILLLLRSYYTSNPKQCGKMILHLIAGTIVVDIFWMLVIIPYWNAEYNSIHWNSLGGLRTFVSVLSFVELGIKAFIGWMMFNNYKVECNDNLEDLFKLGYSEYKATGEIIL